MHKHTYTLVIYNQNDGQNLCGKIIGVEHAALTGCDTEQLFKAAKFLLREKNGLHEHNKANPIIEIAYADMHDLERKQLRHEALITTVRREELCYKALNDTMKTIINSLVLVNGGAAVAAMPIINSFINASNNPTNIIDSSKGLACFALGIILAVIAAVICFFDYTLRIQEIHKLHGQYSPTFSNELSDPYKAYSIPIMVSWRAILFWGAIVLSTVSFFFGVSKIVKLFW